MNTTVIILLSLTLLLLAWRKGYLHDFYLAIQGKWTV